MGDTKIYNIENIGTAQFFSQSLDYQTLMGRIEKKQQRVQKLQKIGETELALEIGAELAADEQQLEQLKEDVLRLYETFTKIEIDTERLAKAKAHFDKGEFREADAILDAETMAKDLDQLIERDQQLTEEKAAIAKSREQLSNEYLVKARLRATFYDRPNRFEETCEHFENALNAVRTSGTIFEYALFLHNHNDFKQARPLYNEALSIRRELAKKIPHIYWPYVATTLNNLANLQAAQNEYEEASNSYDEALNIYRKLEQETTHTYLPDIAITLNNLGSLQQAQDKYKKASNSYDEALNIYRELEKEPPRTYLPDIARTLHNVAVLQQAQNEYKKASNSYDEALSIRRKLAKEAPRIYLPDVARTLNNLAVLQSDQNAYEQSSSSYDETLSIYRKLAKENPRTYLPDVAMTLNNLGLLQEEQNAYEQASSSYDEALSIYRKLARENPRTYLPNVASTLINLSIFYYQAKPDKTESVAMAKEVIVIAQAFPQVPSVQHYAEIAQQVLQANGVEG